MQLMNVIKDNLAFVQQRIASACQKAGRETDAVKLLLATKTVSAENIKVALAAGANLIGENKVQELKEKDAELRETGVDRHFIGHLQTNKIKDVLKYVSCIQSVDRLDLVQKLDARLQSEGRSVDIMIQINTSFEASKFGIHPDEALTLLEAAARYDTLNIKGLMTIGLFDADPERIRPSFRLLRQISQHAMDAGILPADARELCMGMSGDLETAISEGATMVRVGTAVFGKRLYPDSYYWKE
ncbi:YggS family pyridoxal phosphate-dependent enzyme [Chitinophaga horti]|uniref:Pyridoxal phosphate homeostasis protein n=1 Tax=Chitinophaga horti TaxID=2920382 RepID=A0ABY6IX70_9BACT|nr:YggS family pyridoxal phosphate-dependent enzyme [Chitinophaga horti]UYQ91985.1 YggS family pyridoxal phosphate-dependent enzyme [Chitinophaga horti]